MTLEEQIELDQCEREIAKLNRAIRNSCLAASQAGSPGWHEALARIGKAKLRIAELRGEESHG